MMTRKKSENHAKPYVQRVDQGRKVRASKPCSLSALRKRMIMIDMAV